MTTDAPQQIQRQFPIHEVLGRYRERLAETTERAIIAEATAAAAEQECATLRLALVEAQEQVTNDAG
jgi:hypothetical protein